MLRLLLIVTLLMSCTSIEKNRQQDQQSIVQLIERLVKSEESTDLPAYLALWREDSIQVFPDTEDLVGKSAISASIAEMFLLGQPSIKTEIEEIIIEGNISIIRLTAFVKTAADQKNNTQGFKLRGILIAKREHHNGWKLWREMAF